MLEHKDWINLLPIIEKASHKDLKRIILESLIQIDKTCKLKRIKIELDEEISVLFNEEIDDEEA